MSTTDDRIVRIENDVKEIRESVHAIDKSVQRQEDNLRQHVRSTRATDRRTTLVERELQPIKRHLQDISFLVKLVGFLSGFLTLTYTVLKIRESLMAPPPKPPTTQVTKDPPHAQMPDVRPAGPREPKRHER